MKTSRLAIVIPAYKITFFEKALRSIASQTCKEFTLYIGNDGSGSDFESVINQYTSQINIVYKKFDNNLGRQNLVAHWERCVEMVGSEEWIWLFSDDDFMSENCVEQFYAVLNESPSFDVYHFNINVVNESDEITSHEHDFPEIMQASEFVLGRLNHQLMSLVVEYIFRKSHFIANNRFQWFDLAWGSDDATWIKLSMDKGIRTINDARVYWRRSDLNISFNIDKDILLRKCHARLAFVSWLIQFNHLNKSFIEKGLLIKTATYWFANSLRSSILIFTYSEIRKFIDSLFDITTRNNIHKLSVTSRLFFYKIKKQLKRNIIQIINK